MYVAPSLVYNKIDYTLALLRRIWVYIVRLCVLIILLECPASVWAQVRFELPLEPAQVADIANSWDNPHLTLSQRINTYISRNPQLVPSYKKTANFDSISGRFIIEESIFKEQKVIPLVMNPTQYREKLLQNVFQSSFREIIITRQQAEKTKDQQKNQGVGFTVPIPMGSRTFQKIFGSAGVGLRVNGNVSLQGSLINQQQSVVKTAINQSSDYTFKLEQKQRFQVTGKIGEKVDVMIDQDSERDFDFENNLRIFYTGEEDEIVKKIEAGNISLSLPATRFVTVSGSNSGLFGLKTDMKIGNLDLTTIASIEKGQKQKLSIKGGKEAQVNTLKDYNYVTGIYFFVDHFYRDNYKVDINTGLFFISPDPVEELELWKGGRNYQLRPDAREAWSVADPTIYKNSGNNPTQEDQNTRHQYFQRLEQNKDYFLNKELGYIVLAQAINTELLAVAYRTRSGKEVGDVIPQEGKVLILKLIRNDRPLPSDKSWRLEWRNVYSLGGRNLTKEGLDIALVNNRTSTREKIDKSGKNYLEIFGLDRFSETGQNTPDDKADFDNVNIFNLAGGVLIFPDLEPFNSHLYDTTFVNPSDYNKYSDYDIEIKSSSASASYNLGFNVLDGSEEVNLDGRKLTKGVDYEIDYTFGSLRIINEDALRPGANLDIRYESGQVFQLDKKSLFGMRGEYHLWDQSFIGFTGIYTNERILEQRVRVGQEPVRNLVWDFNTALTFEPKIVTSLIDKLPLLDTKAPSKISFEAEVGQILPNPNTLNNTGTKDNDGVAFLDDFESSTRLTTIPINRKNWTRSSSPFITELPPDQSIFDRHGKMIWYNPWQQVLLTDIFPDKEINTRSGTHQNVLTLQRRSNSNHPTKEPWWAGIMTALSTSYFNQSESKFVEIWVQGDKGTVHLDMGLMSEDVVPNLKLDTEDFVGGIPNGILDPGEDVGLDGIAAPDRLNNGEPFDDDWNYSDRGNDYEAINGMEGSGSGTKVDGARIPDTEDISQNGNLDLRNDYFEYTINIAFNGPDYAQYVVGGQPKDPAKDKKWRLYRIPLSDFKRKVGNPEFTRIEFMRIWIEDLDVNDQITIASINFMGNDWKELGVASKLDSTEFKPRPDALTVAAINTEENAAQYVLPPGVSGMEDRVTGVRLREQSLVMRYTGIHPGESAAVQKSFFDNQDIIHYERLKMFVHGDTRAGNIVVNQDSASNVMLYFRFGRDDKNYFEIREFVFPGWDRRNEIDIPLRQLSAIFFDTTGGHPVWGKGKYYSYRGTPTVRQLQVISIGIVNMGDIPISGEFWFDELRVSNVEKKPGIAERARTDITLADLGNITVETNKKDAEFRTVNDRFGTGSNSLDGNISGSLNMGKFLSSENVYNLPISFAINRTQSNPKYLTGKDVLAIKGNIPDSVYQREITNNNSSRFNFSFSKTRKSKNWLLANTFDQLSFTFGQTQSLSNDYNTQFTRNASQNLGLNYALSLGQRQISPFKFLGDNFFLFKKLSQAKFAYLPDNFSFSSSYSGSKNNSMLRGSTEKQTNSANLNRNLSTGYSPFQSLKFSLNRTYENDLRPLKSRMSVFSGKFGDGLGMNQNFGGEFNPKFLSFLTNSFSYQSGYGLSNNVQLRAAGKSARSDNTKTARFTLSMNQIFKTTGSRGGGGGGGKRRPPPRRGKGQGIFMQQQPTPETPPQSGGTNDNAPFFLIRGVGFVCNRIEPISLTLTQAQGVQVVGLNGNPTSGFMFGFSQDPGAPVLTSVGTQQGGSTDRNNFGLSSGLNLSSKVRTTLRYNKDLSENSQGLTRTGTSSESYYISGDKKIPFPEWQVNVSGVEKLWPFKKFFQSVSITHGYSGKKSSSLQDRRDTQTFETLFEPVNNSYSSGFAPLIGMNINWKNNISTSVNYGNSETLMDDLKIGSSSKTVQKNMTVTSRYSKSGGLRIPLPFFSNKELKNSIDFQISYTMGDNVSLRTNPKGQFIESAAQSNWSVKPEIRYSFSSKITGGMHFELGQQKNKLSGDQKVKDFGILVNIAIQG